MKYGLIGEKLGHSYSKIVQEQLVKDYLYEINPLQKNEFDKYMTKKDFLGINVTIPYKRAVMPYLDKIEENAEKIGAINTIVNEKGILSGYNTDYLGFMYLLKKNNIQIKNKKILILGNGGGSKAVQQAVKINLPKEIVILEHNDNSLNNVYKNHTDCQVIINATPQGMYPNIDGYAIDIERFHHLQAVIDIVYNPLNTEIVLRAREKGIVGISGIQMLVAQAKYAVELFKGIAIEDTEIERICDDLLYEKNNIVLIGMPSCGKSTVGKMLSERMGKTIIDIDEKIIEKIGISIAEFFKKYGEEKFREVESEVIRYYSGMTNGVIACGGGVVKNYKNIHELKRNGVIFFIDRDLKYLFPSGDRPLSVTKEHVEKLYKDRIDFYRNYSQIKINNNGSLEKTVDEIINSFKDYNKIIGD